MFDHYKINIAIQFLDHVIWLHLRCIYGIYKHFTIQILTHQFALNCYLACILKGIFIYIVIRVWSASKTSNYTLDKVQNQALRLITGSMRSTPIKIMEEITAIQPLSKKGIIMIQAERYKCSPSHPMKTKIHDMTKNRIKRESFIHKTNTLSKIYESSSNIVQSTYSSPPPCQNTTRSIDIKVTIPAVTRDEDDTSKKLLTLSYIDVISPQDTWIHIYTDGSATDAIQDGGAGSIIYLPDGDTIESATATGKHCTNYAAEVKALSQGAQAILDIVGNHKEDVVFLTDSSIGIRCARLSWGA